MKKKLRLIPKFVVLALLLYMPVFGFLTDLPIRVWDEARIAVNAHEMYSSGEYIITTYDESPDMWNTKPPLLIWLQVLLMKIIGPGELAVRLPSALAAFFTCIVLLAVSMRYLKNFWLGFSAVLVLITCEGYVTMHGTRTGDYDALLTFFTTSGCFFFFAFTESKNIKYLYLFFAALAGGVLTKGIAGLLFTPALVLFALMQKQVVLLLKNRHFYLALFGFLFIAIGYYLLREWKNPGYIGAVQENELGGRYLTSQGETKIGFWFYYENFLNERMSDRYLLVPCGIVLGLLSRDARIRKLTLFSFTMGLVFFVVISSAATRLTWYDTPLYPFLAIFIAVFVNFLFELINNLEHAKPLSLRPTLPFVFLFLLFIMPYKKMFMQHYKPAELYWDLGVYHVGYYLKQAVDGKHNMNNRYLAYEGYYAQNLFYIRILRERGVETSRRNMDQLKAGDQVIACQDTVKNFIKDHFTYSERKENGNVVSYKLISTHSAIKTYADTIPANNK